jgi:alkanesulfonate monooxygenase SsuD/methylene tetrahydromethanopterin reductase-like flavin-dependent oxidoreductase (luciferase family)
VKFGAHLPILDFDGAGWQARDLEAYTDAARELGFDAIASNDHFVFQKPWLDGIVSLASVIGRSGDMRLVTTIALPVVRHPVALAKAAAALDILSGGRLTLGVGPGSSARDYEAVGLDFNERWPRLDQAIRVLRAHLRDGAPQFEGSFYNSNAVLEPRPNRPGGPAIWIGSWGSDAGLRRVARLGDGWLASAYNTTPQDLRAARQKLDGELGRQGKDPSAFPASLATMWMYVTEDRSEHERYLSALATMLNRPAEAIAGQVLIGPAEQCAAKLRDYAEAGVTTVFVWPLGDNRAQLERLMTRVAGLVPD